MIRCQACGTENPPDASYCANCARKLDTETQQQIVQQRAAHTATGLRWSSVLAAILIALILIVVVILLITHVL